MITYAKNSVFQPVHRALDGLEPALVELGPGAFLHVRLVGLVDLPVLAQVLQVVPVAHGQAGGVGRAEARGLGHDGTRDRHAEDVGLHGEADYAFSVTSYAFPIQRAIRITSDERVEMFSPEHFNTRSQDLEDAFHDAGQFYWGLAAAWLAGKPLFSHCATPVPLPRHRVQDIDTAEDWERAEWLFKAMQVQRD